MTLLAFLAAQAIAPVPSELRTFRDWTVGCDNGLACEAVALLPEEADWDQWTTLSLSRRPEADAAPVVMLPDLDGVPASLWADGTRVPVRFVPGEAGVTIESERPQMLVDALRRGQAMELRAAEGTVLKRISLSGAAAAMLFIDETQRRLGTTTALVHQGRRAPATIPPPPALPEVRIAAAPEDAPLDLSPSRISQLRRDSGCTIDEVGGPDEHETAQIASGTTLVLLACGTGAYNLSSVPFIARREGGRIVTRIADFDSQWGVAAEGRPTLINAFWSVEDRLLVEHAKGRGIGDCGTHSEYGWDGARFRLIRQEEMGECRGSTEFIRTWNSDVIGR